MDHPETLWMPRKWVKLIQLFHDGVTEQAFYSGDRSAAFAISSEVK